MRISVIIPAYNAADMIVSCLQSVVGVGETEVIVVDDGSSDGTAGLVRSEFPEVIVLQQPNKGVSAARNAGIQAATGDYLAFVDADDSLSHGALQAAAQVAGETRADFLILRSFCGKEEQYPWKSRFQEESGYRKADILAAGYVRGSACGCLFRRAFLLEKDLFFPEGIAMAEDQLFVNSAIAAGADIRFRDLRFYEVSERPGSVSRVFDDCYFQRLAAALRRAPSVISDAPLCSQIRLSIILGMTRAAIVSHRSPAWVYRTAGLGEILPIPVRGVRSHRILLRILNIRYPLLYRLMQARLLVR